MEQKCHQCVVRDLNSLKKANPEDLTDIDGHKKSLYFKKGESLCMVYILAQKIMVM